MLFHDQGNKKTRLVPGLKVAGARLELVSGICRTCQAFD
jgi:hypothetical protein